MQFFIIKPVLAKLCMDLLQSHVYRLMFRTERYRSVGMAKTRSRSRSRSFSLKPGAGVGVSKTRSAYVGIAATENISRYMS